MIRGLHAARARSLMEVETKGTPGRLSRAVWRKSRPRAACDNCVEAHFVDSAIAVRDSKEPDGPALIYAGEWDAFVGGAKTRFDQAGNA